MHISPYNTFSHLKAGFDTPLMGGQFSGGENWDAEMRVLKVCTDKVWVLPAKRVYCL